MLFETIGWIGGVCLIMCGIPQLIKTYRTKSASDLSWMFLWLWFLGEVFSLVYVFENNIRGHEWQLPLIANYLFNILVLVFLIFGKMKFDKNDNNVTDEVKKC